MIFTVCNKTVIIITNTVINFKYFFKNFLIIYHLSKYIAIIYGNLGIVTKCNRLICKRNLLINRLVYELQICIQLQFLQTDFNLFSLIIRFCASSFKSSQRIFSPSFKPYSLRQFLSNFLTFSHSKQKPPALFGQLSQIMSHPQTRVTDGFSEFKK